MEMILSQRVVADIFSLYGKLLPADRFDCKARPLIFCNNVGTVTLIFFTP